MSKTDALPLGYISKVSMLGIEPKTYRLKVYCSTPELHTLESVFKFYQSKAPFTTSYIKPNPKRIKNNIIDQNPYTPMYCRFNNQGSKYKTSTSNIKNKIATI